jgi:large repetitive protein
VTYTPSENFSGTDVLVYEVCDADGLCDVASVTITINQVNDGPTANPDTATTPYMTPVIVNVVANDTDPESDPLTITSNTNPSNGIAVCSATGCTYTPNTGFVGTDTFDYTISDGNG